MNTDFTTEFTDLFNHLGLSFNAKLADFERQLRQIFLAIEKDNIDSLYQKDESISDEQIEKWLTRLEFEIDNSFNGDSEQAVQALLANKADLKYVDLFIIGGDVELNNEGLPVLLDSRSSIAQDIKHMIIETGLLVQCIGERDFEKRKLAYNRIERNVDEDYRTISGTCLIDESEGGNFWLTVETEEYNQIRFYL